MTQFQIWWKLNREHTRCKGVGWVEEEREEEEEKGMVGGINAVHERGYEGKYEKAGSLFYK